MAKGQNRERRAFSLADFSAKLRELCFLVPEIEIEAVKPALKSTRRGAARGKVLQKSLTA
jgi:hypothetical protein